MKHSTRTLLGATALALAVPLTVGLAGPASAVRATHQQDADITIGDSVFYIGDQNGAGITIPDSGPATPHPSQITFTGETGNIADIDLYLGGINHSSAEDLDILLVGPGGQQATVMSDAGGFTALAGTNLSFDDEATSALTADGVSSGWYQPTNLGGADAFGGGAPAATGSSTLSVFDGTSPNGTWNLYVVDDASGDSGTIDYWGLEIKREVAGTTPSPSTLTVANQLPVISDVDVTLTGLTHTYADDLDVLLIGPSGQQATLVSDAGGSDEVNALSFTLDDEAAAALPDEDPLTAGTFKPTNYENGDWYPAPAPASTHATSLAAFDGTNPNGVWKLFVFDDEEGDDGSLGGWSLSIDAVDPAAPAGTVAINGGAARTANTTVTLNVAASDPAPASGVRQMRFSNDGATYSAWMPYAATAAWQLPAGNGTRTVWAQFADAGGNVSAAATDAIVLDTVAPGVKSTKPAKSATDVKRDATIKVKSTEALSAATVTKASVVLKEKGSSKKVKAKVTYKAAKNQIVLDPKGDLNKKATYKVIVKTTIKDLAGNAFDAKSKSGAQPLKWKFTTS